MTRIYIYLNYILYKTYSYYLVEYMHRIHIFIYICVYVYIYIAKSVNKFSFHDNT